MEVDFSRNRSINGPFSIAMFDDTGGYVNCSGPLNVDSQFRETVHGKPQMNHEVQCHLVIIVYCCKLDSIVINIY